LAKAAIIMIVGFLKNGCPFGVPICPKGIEGPQEPAEKEKTLALILS
jgi:hypothetical protein